MQICIWLLSVTYYKNVKGSPVRSIFFMLIVHFGRLPFKIRPHYISAGKSSAISSALDLQFLHLGVEYCNVQQRERVQNHHVSFYCSNTAQHHKSVFHEVFTLSTVVLMLFHVHLMSNIVFRPRSNMAFAFIYINVSPCATSTLWSMATRTSFLTSVI